MLIVDPVRKETHNMFDFKRYSEVPDGPKVQPATGVYEYADPRNEQAVLKRWSPVLEKLGIEVYRIEKVPTATIRITIDGIDWDLGPMDMSKHYDVPSTVYQKYMAALSAGVPFMWYLWAEELPQRPLLKAFDDAPVWKSETFSTPSPTRKVDPIFIGVIPTGPDRGIWCMLGKWFH